MTLYSLYPFDTMFKMTTRSPILLCLLVQVTNLEKDVSSTWINYNIIFTFADLPSFPKNI